MNDDLSSLAYPTIGGQSVLQQTLAPYVTQSSLEFQLQDFSSNNIGQFTLPLFNIISQTKPAEGPVEINGQRLLNVADPQQDSDGVNKRSTIVNDQSQTEDPITHNLYSTMSTGDRSVIVKDVIDPIVPTVPGTQWDTLVKRQATTKKYVDAQRDKCILKNTDINFTNHKGVNCADPSSSGDVVNKSYCDSNSKNSDGTGALTGLLGGILGGALSSALITTVGQGLNTFGQISGSLALGTASLQGAMKLGSTADFNRYQPGVGESDQLIQNLKDDIANRPQGQPDAGTLMNSAMSITGLLRAKANTLYGIFDI